METILLKVGHFSALFVQNRPKFYRRIVRPFHFLFGQFWLMWPNNRPVGNTVYLGRAWSKAVDDVGAGLGAQHPVPDGRHRKVEQKEHWKTRQYITNFAITTKTKWRRREEIYNALFNRFFHLKRLRFNKNKHKIHNFMTNGLLISRNTKKILHQASISEPSALNIQKYKNFNTVYHGVLRGAKRLYYTSKLEEFN